MVKHSPITTIAELDGRPVHSVEVDIILAHELVQVHVFGVKPPLFPVLGIVGSDTWVTNWRIELSQSSHETQQILTL